MKTKHVGSSFRSLLVKEEKKSPKLKAFLMEAREKSVLAHLLKETRVKEGLTQKDLAKLAGVSQAYVARLEPHPDAPSKLPSIDAYLKLINYMGYLADITLKKAA